MKKVINNIEFTAIKAIASCDNVDPSCVQDALLMVDLNDEFHDGDAVVFGCEMPTDFNDVRTILADSACAECCFSINADVQVRPAPAQKRKPSGARSLVKPSKPPKQFDVGVRLGNAMRRYKYEHPADDHPKSNTGSHSTHRPHSRRGHWHHFWTGKRSEPENRKLVLQWVEPTFVGGKSTDATLFRLKKKTDSSKKRGK